MNLEEMIPPEELIYTGRTDYLATGNCFCDYFRQYGGLQPHHRVLDIGSGIGRMTVPLTQYLDSRGSYEGLEIVDVGVRWCQEKITPRYPNFRFQWADVYNQGYNPGGKHHPDQYVLPYPSNHFDFVFLTSVFTHMMTDDVENYLYEIARVMKPGATCLITYFLIDNVTTLLTTEGKSVFSFRHHDRHCHIANPDLPEDVVGFEVHYLQGLYRRMGFSVDQILYGNWSGRLPAVSYQDMVVARKVRSAGPLARMGRLGTRLMNAAKRRLRRGQAAVKGYGLINQVVEEAKRSAHRLG